MPEFKVHNLWPVPIYQSRIKTKDEWKEKIVNFKYGRTNVGNSDITEDRNILDRMPDLKSEIEIHTQNYIRKYLHIKKDLDFYMLNSWVNIHRPNDWSQIHNHGNSLLSGVYYPVFPKDGGGIIFHRCNRINLFDQCIMMEYDEDTIVNAARYQIDVSEDLILLFPSHLEHSVNKNLSNKNRYSLAFNYYVRGKLGKEEYQLELK
tara:strand:+ start:549 stop:1163 length:615 start_codon:yes stop_codon:yes gene_type:complete